MGNSGGSEDPSPVYFGESITKLDDKGRITVPRRVRETMDVYGHAIWYMTRGFDHAIFLFPREEWMKIRAQAGRFSAMDARVVDFRRLFFAGVAEAKPDNQGRIMIPSHLREHAGLTDEGVLIGVDDHLELWNRDTWRAFVEGKDADYKEMAASVFSQSESGEAEMEKGGRRDDD